MKYGEILEKLSTLDIGLTDEIDCIQIDTGDNEISANWSKSDFSDSIEWYVYGYKRWPEREALAAVHVTLPPLPEFQTVGEVFEGMQKHYDYGWWDMNDGDWLGSVVSWEYVGDMWW